MSSLTNMLVKKCNGIVVKREGGKGYDVYFSYKSRFVLCTVQYLYNYHVFYEIWQYVNSHRSWTLTKPVNTLALQIAANVAYSVQVFLFHNAVTVTHMATCT